MVIVRTNGRLKEQGNSEREKINEQGRENLATPKKTDNNFENTKILIRVMLYTTLPSHFTDVTLYTNQSLDLLLFQK